MSEAGAPQTASEIIDRWPSPKAFGDDIGVKLSHVHVMKVRGSIPARRWPKVVEAARSRGIEVSLDQIERAHSPQPTPAAEQGVA